MATNTPGETAQAIEAIGTDAPEDWSLTPMTYAAKLPREAAALKRVLDRSVLQETSGTFEAADKAAVRAQRRYKILVGWSAFLSLVAVLVAAALLFTSARSFGPGPHLGWIAGAQGACLVLSFILSLAASHTRQFDSWMRARAEAEHQRFLFFNRVTRATEDRREDELRLLPLQLEFFRRYQLEVQRKYYHERGRQHARAVLWGSVLRWLATLLIIMAAIPTIATFLGFDVGAWFAAVGLPAWGREVDVQQRLFLALSTSGAALQGWLAARGLMNQDERNANRYAATASNLDALAERPLDEARVAAARDDAASVRTFIALVQEQISSEHREWVDLRSIAPALSLERLKEQSLPRLE